VVVAGFVEARNQMVGAWARRSRTDGKAACQFRLACRRKCSALLVSHSDPLDAAPPHGIAEWIERISDQAEDLLNADLFQYAHDHLRYGLSHRFTFSDCA
jgi:hypothetical protein